MKLDRSLTVDVVASFAKLQNGAQKIVFIMLPETAVSNYGYPEPWWHSTTAQPPNHGHQTVFALLIVWLLIDSDC